ncbi:hypothetical protein T265_10061 [Opisthorchis viverrini]|uniref:Uncharacterized protein n=1 Tax=Opisthorchis viverrini TaxID=6198 RepID=A0A074Z3N9_OPIVI|nr:hypothetical protein T265_10061 [Opisthorchis viverrini]KER21671.1 hypothetical protein T265_10061 [Opisthorchis viverrini]
MADLMVPTEKERPSSAKFLGQMVVGSFAELGNLVANVSSPIEVTSSAQPLTHRCAQLRTDDVTSIGDETFATKLPSSANEPTTI